MTDTLATTLVHIGQYKAIKGLLSVVCAFLFGAYTPQMYAAIGVLMLIDILTGIHAALRGGDFTSTSLRKKTFSKSLTYITMMIAASMAHKMAAFLHWIPTGTLTWIAVTEISSIFENLSKITGRKIPNLQDLYNLVGTYTRKNNTLNNTQEEPKTITVNTRVISEDDHSA